MKDFNTVIIEGNLTFDPHFQKLGKKETPFASFSIASNRYFKKDNKVEKEVSFFDIEAWNELAERVEEIGHKGRGVRITGRLKQVRYTKGEQNLQRVIIVAENCEFNSEPVVEEIT